MEGCLLWTTLQILFVKGRTSFLSKTINDLLILKFCYLRTKMRSSLNANTISPSHMIYFVHPQRAKSTFPSHHQSSKQSELVSLKNLLGRSRPIPILHCVGGTIEILNSSQRSRGLLAIVPVYYRGSGAVFYVLSIITFSLQASYFVTMNR